MWILKLFRNPRRGEFTIHISQRMHILTRIHNCQSWGLGDEDAHELWILPCPHNSLFRICMWLGLCSPTISMQSTGLPLVVLNNTRFIKMEYCIVEKKWFFMLSNKTISCGLLWCVQLESYRLTDTVEWALWSCALECIDYR